MTRAAFRYDVRSLLPQLAVPTLVVHRRDDPGATIEHGRYLAEHIPDATYVELPGQEHTYFLGNDDAILGAVRAFIDERVAGGAMQSAVRRAERRGNYGYGWDALTPAEREVATLVAQGLTNAEVADRLGTSRFTVDGRLRRIFTKLDVTTRVEPTAEYARLTRSWIVVWVCGSETQADECLQQRDIGVQGISLGSCVDSRRLVLSRTRLACDALRPSSQCRGES
jgi:DNA-binding CsgD family transcriptional regulator